MRREWNIFSPPFFFGGGLLFVKGEMFPERVGVLFVWIVGALQEVVVEQWERFSSSCW
jgi:hypothetical protein